MPELITVQQAAEEKGCTVQTVRNAYRARNAQGETLINVAILNPDDPEARHVMRVIKDAAYEAWQPRQYNKKSD